MFRSRPSFPYINLACFIYMLLIMAVLLCFAIIILVVTGSLF